MAEFQAPVQCLKYAKRQSEGLEDVLIASAGGYVYSYAASSGQRIGTWPALVDTNVDPASTEAPPSEDQTPPEKRRKLSPSSEIQTEGCQVAKNGTNKQSPAWSNIPVVLPSLDGKYVVILTAEDKCLRVLNLGEDGSLQELSSRTMPKRPIALDLTPDGKTILCADKFGDVYSLPLIPGEYVKPIAQAKNLQPAATTLTVHSKRNLSSLEQQKMHAEKTSKNPTPVEEKSALNFEHQLIIGHVSLLTDVISATLPGETAGGRSRNYILTADRDEHIRVSRGIPQAHIIEQQCFGHTSIVSKLCIPSWNPKVLISGGNDGHLILWNWSEGKILQKAPLDESLQEFAVCGIWDILLEQLPGASGPVKIILVALEGSPELLCYTLENDNTLKLQDTTKLSGNVLDLAVNTLSGAIAVSVDGVREPGSTDSWKASPEPPSLDVQQKKQIDDSLYVYGNLRKRKHDEEKKKDEE
ncbi:tRNA (guanine-N(7)-)-methyltransferase non-catalytic subunit trm82 [Penicillium macrosclerotiorum]|uniref:tRNA (guanine-N(7)-)-methyltransferase non-catalytic subunit trm82 n=1 Tax=Penicillium macrosclerotiorum TaxID=303699 RepID=UPI002548E6CE|nr:tRNA (guanine-N(7)-)-methyltransferase non-catalytic subunit trm82 [Penicillium macrosclerotiorum]KAJ5688668.1 tRNA (guanine-N(7)-)-methyltransferase non-catalytic subunit trm82 [Penicillium macrosclerotiorum]